MKNMGICRAALSCQEHLYAPIHKILEELIFITQRRKVRLRGIIICLLCHVILTKTLRTVITIPIFSLLLTEPVLQIPRHKLHRTLHLIDVFSLKVSLNLQRVN